MFSKSLIAIDFGSSAIKLVEFADPKAQKLKNAGLETLPANSIVDGVISDADEVTNCVSELMDRLKISKFGRRAGISVGGNAVMMKKVYIPEGMAGGELIELVSSEAEQNFHADLRELYWEYLVLNEVPDSQGEVPVLLTGVSKDVVDGYIEAVRNVGLRVGVVDCDVFCVMNSYEHNYGFQDKIKIFLNIGAKISQMSIVNAGEYLYSRDINFGGDDYTAAIKENLDLSFENAETMKISASQIGGEQNPEIVNIISEVNNQLSGHISNSIADFLQMDNNFGGEMDSIVLSGGSSKVLGLDAAIAAELQIPASIMNPFAGVDLKKSNASMDYLLEQGHLFGVASGLALRKFNEK